METIRIDRSENGVATITLNRPEQANSLNTKMATELLRAIPELRADVSVGAVVLTGAGRLFCAGGDLVSLRMEAATAPEAKRFLEICHEFLLSMVQMEKPVVAAINGHAYGAGFNLALAADLLVASEEAEFCQAFVRVGAVPDLGGAYFLPQLVGMQRAKELILLARPIKAAEAREMGLVNRVVPAQDVLTVAQEMAATLANGPRWTIGVIKKMLHSGANTDLKGLLDLEANLQAVIFQSDEFREGCQAFSEKRPPNWPRR